MKAASGRGIRLSGPVPGTEPENENAGVAPGRSGIVLFDLLCAQLIERAYTGRTSRRRIRKTTPAKDKRETTKVAGSDASGVATVRNS